MPSVPDEVQEEPIYGTNSSDIILDTAKGQSGYYGLGGNDVFMAHADDAILEPGSRFFTYYDDHFHGGSGTDAASYIFSDSAISGSMTLGGIHRYFANGVLRSTDYVYSIENLIGSAYSDHVWATNGANDLRGGGGHDTFYADGGNDNVWGDSGNDTLFGGEGHDSLYGGTGNDEIRGDSGNDRLWGDSGHDNLWGGAGHDKIYGGSGNDTIYGNSGNDNLDGGDGADDMRGGTGNDRMSGGAQGDTMLGGAGNDTIEGGTGDDNLSGGNGVDTVVYTGNGAVTVNLWQGYADGAMGNDVLSGFERVETGSGNDIVYGTFGSEHISTGAGNDLVYAFDGHDIVNAGAGNDTVYGYEGNDIVNAGSGHDRVLGGDDADVLNGDGGNDVIYGDAGNDQINGGSGNDRLNGGDGIDSISGGAGSDTIFWRAGDAGADVISGFDLTDDRLWFETDYFAFNPVGAVELSDVLMVFDSGDHAMLTANTADQGWVLIATLLDVDAYDIGQMIEDGSILADVVVAIPDVPDDFGFF